MAKLTHLMIHNSATPAGVWFDKKDIIAWHTDPKPKGNGWSKPGYSDLILLDGTIESLIPYDYDDHVETWEISNGAAGWNGRTRHICYIGGIVDGEPMDTRSPAQAAQMKAYVLLTLRMQPWIKLIGHNQVNAHKSCPGFDVRAWAREIGVKDENIDDHLYVDNEFLGTL